MKDYDFKNNLFGSNLVFDVYNKSYNFLLMTFITWRVIEYMKKN